MRHPRSSHRRPDANYSSYHDQSPLELLVQRTSLEPRDSIPSPVSGLTVPRSPTSPLLQAGFRSSTATSVTSDAYGPLTANSSHVQLAPQYTNSYTTASSVVSSPLRAPITGTIVPSANFSRPRPPITQESERAKKEVLQRVKASRSTEHLAHDAPIDVPQPRRGTDTSLIANIVRDEGVKCNVGNTSSPKSILKPWSHSNPPFLTTYDPNDLQAGPNSQPKQQAASYQDSKLAREGPYERYSYYELPSPLPSPSALKSTSFSVSEQANIATRHPKPNGADHTQSTDLRPEDYLMLGIKTHLQGSASTLSQSATFFEISATLNGGCGFGMLMWGLSLRHGWGVKADERQGFMWLRRACELAVGGLEGLDKVTPTQEKIRQEVKAELILAIYEVGQCFFQGWGVQRDRAMGFKYFLMAAQLGDLDAQQELGYCYSNGKGCKKDRREAARWYRAAAAQGASTVGLAWIYKDKFK